METLPLPKKVDVTPGQDFEAVVTIEPCFPGYGMTLGNALRRVLLSSLSGAAVTAIKINKVEHEFSTLPYMQEDVVALLLNVKLLRFRLHSETPVTVMLHAKGDHKVTGADIKATSDVEIINPEQHIATLTDASAELDIEMTISPGRGYVPVENREKEKLPLGTIAVDAIYTPVRNVNFKVEHVRVEQMTNYDKLMLTVRTDGTITPVDAVRQAAEILRSHFEFINTLLPVDKQSDTTEAPKKKKAAKKTVKGEAKNEVDPEAAEQSKDADAANSSQGE